jgi:hypothetical protein
MMQKQFKTYIKENKKDVADETDLLETEKKPRLAQLEIGRRTVQNFIKKIKDKF